MKIYQVAIKRHKKRPKSHVGKMEGAYHGKDQGHIDTRLTPVHRYVLQETNFPVVIRNEK